MKKNNIYDQDAVRRILQSVRGGISLLLLAAGSLALRTISKDLHHRKPF